MADAEPHPDEVEAVLAVLHEALRMSAAAVARREARGEGTVPASLAVNALVSVIADISSGRYDPAQGYGLGLTRGAGDWEWPAAEQRIVDLLSRAEALWRAAGQATQPPSPEAPPPQFSVRHVNRSPRPGPRPPVDPD